MVIVTVDVDKRLIYTKEEATLNAIDHLFLGTPKDNVHDMIQKGRNNPKRGESHYSAKLTEKDVLEIRNLAAFGLSNQKISSLYPVGPRQIGSIVKRKKWSHI